MTSDGIQTLDAPELRRRSAIVVSRLRTSIDVCKRVLLEKFQDTQCDAAGKLSQSIYVVESLLGKCHQEGDLLFFTIRQDPQVSHGILLPKLFWPTVRKNWSSDREKLLKSIEQFIQTVKGQNHSKWPSSE